MDTDSGAPLPPAPDVLLDRLRALVTESPDSHIQLVSGTLFARLKALNRDALAAVRAHKVLAADARMGMDAPVLQINSSFEFDPDDDVRMTTEVKATTVQAQAGMGSGGTKTEYILNQYKRGPKIGGGQHGTVFICYDMHKNAAIRVRHPFYIDMGYLD